MYLFLSGAEMQPERVRTDWPLARFVARGRLRWGPVDAATTAHGASGDRWGLVLETPDARVAGERTEAETDDGRVLEVVVPLPDLADPAATLAAARYWELPPAYVRGLAEAANAPVEEYHY